MKQKTNIQHLTKAFSSKVRGFAMSPFGVSTVPTWLLLLSHCCLCLGLSSASAAENARAPQSGSTPQITHFERSSPFGQSSWIRVFAIEEDGSGNVERKEVIANDLQIVPRDLRLQLELQLHKEGFIYAFEMLTNGRVRALPVNLGRPPGLPLAPNLPYFLPSHNHHFAPDVERIRFVLVSRPFAILEDIDETSSHYLETAISQVHYMTFDDKSLALTLGDLSVKGKDILPGPKEYQIEITHLRLAKAPEAPDDYLEFAKAMMLWARPEPYVFGLPFRLRVDDVLPLTGMGLPENVLFHIRVLSTTPRGATEEFLEQLRRARVKKNELVADELDISQDLAEADKAEQEGDYTRAHEVLQRAALDHITRNPIAAAQLLMRCGSNPSLTGKQRVAYTEEALSIVGNNVSAAAAPLPVTLAIVYADILQKAARVFNENGDNAHALKQIHQAVEVLDEASRTKPNDTPQLQALLLESLQIRGILLKANGRVQAAKNDFLRLRQLSSPSDQQLRACIHYNLAGIFLDEGEFNKSIYVLEQLIESETVFSPLALLALSNVYKVTGNRTQQLEHLGEYLALNQDQRNTSQHMQALVDLAFEALFEKDFEESERVLRLAFRTVLDPRMGTVKGLYERSFFALAMIYLSKDQLLPAEELLRIIGEPQSPELGWYRLRVQKNMEAFPYFQKFLEKDFMADVPLYRAKGLTGLGLAQEGAGDRVAAKRSLTSAVQLVEEVWEKVPASARPFYFSSLFTSFVTQNGGEQFSLVQTPSFDRNFNRLTPHETLIRILLQESPEKFASQAFNYAELTKGRLLRDQLQVDAEQTPALPPGELAALRDQELLIAYEVTEEESFAFLLRKGKVPEVVPGLPGRPELERKVNEYLAPMNIRRGMSLDSLAQLNVGLGQELFELVLQPALARVSDDETIHVVPDEALCKLPFEILVSEQNTQFPEDQRWLQASAGSHSYLYPNPKWVQFVGETRTFHYWQSATAMNELRRRKVTTAEDAVLVVADPVFNENDERRRSWWQFWGTGKAAKTARATDDWSDTERLSYLENLSDGIRETVGESRNVQILVGETASESTVRALDLSPYRVVAFGTHGSNFPRPDGVGEAALRLSNPEIIGENKKGFDGVLTASEVMEQKYNAQLVLTLACETGLGDEIRGEGMMHLGRAFQFAGAQGVLVSLWNVETESTALLGQSVVSNLLNRGGNSASALREARKELINAGYRHPFFWGPFVLYGE